MKWTREDKRTTRELVRSHLKLALTTLKERNNAYFLLRAERCIDDAEQLMRTSGKMLPPRSRNALVDSIYTVRKKLQAVTAEWKQHRRDSGIVDP
jgi:uncharacterized membrane protein